MLGESDIWNLYVVALDDNGACVIDKGDDLYINTVTHVISKMGEGLTQIPFGYALGQVTAGMTKRVAVVISSFDPSVIAFTTTKNAVMADN